MYIKHTHTKICTIQKLANCQFAVVCVCLKMKYLEHPTIRFIADRRRVFENVVVVN